METTFRLMIELSANEAWAFAQFLKRAGFAEYRALAVDEAEGYAMRDAGEAIRKALAEAGCAPR